MEKDKNMTTPNLQPQTQEISTDGGKQVVEPVGVNMKPHDSDSLNHNNSGELPKEVEDDTGCQNLNIQHAQLDQNAKDDHLSQNTENDQKQQVCEKVESGSSANADLRHEVEDKESSKHHSPEKDNLPSEKQESAPLIEDNKKEESPQEEPQVKVDEETEKKVIGKPKKAYQQPGKTSNEESDLEYEKREAEHQDIEEKQIQPQPMQPSDVQETKVQVDHHNHIDENKDSKEDELIKSEPKDVKSHNSELKHEEDNESQHKDVIEQEDNEEFQSNNDKIENVDDKNVDEAH